MIQPLFKSLMAKKTSRSKYQFVLSMALIAAFFSISLPAFAQGQGTYGVGVSTLTVRSEPAVQSKPIGYLKRNTVVTVYGKRFGWAKIHYKGHIGWVASQFLYQSHSANPPSHNGGPSSTHKVMVDVYSVHIRTGPGVNHAIIGYARQGEVFRFLGKKAQWVRVRLHNGGTGWIAGWLVTSASKRAGGEPLKGYNIVVDAGHGGFDPGAVAYNGMFEKTLTLETAKKVAAQLRQAGATVIMTRSSDRFLTLAERVRISTLYNTHAFISIHYNAFVQQGATGISTYYYHDSGRKLARDIQQALANNIRLQNDGVRFGNYYVLRENPDTAVLVELGFITNPYDLSFIRTSMYQTQVAKAITEGVEDYFGK